jgi:hypothetical protein
MRFSLGLRICAAAILVVMPLVAGELAPKKEATNKTSVPEKSVHALHDKEEGSKTWPDTETPKKAIPSGSRFMAARTP